MVIISGVPIFRIFTVGHVEMEPPFEKSQIWKTREAGDKTCDPWISSPQHYPWYAEKGKEVWVIQ